MANTVGAPTLPSGYLGSISHKGPIAVALGATTDLGITGVGVDLELCHQRDALMAKRVLGSAERMRLDGAELASTFVTEHFAIKEAAFKALPSILQEGIDFPDLTVHGWRASSGQNAREVDVTVRDATHSVHVELRHSAPWVLAAAYFHQP